MKTIGIILREFNANYKNIELFGIRTEIVEYLRMYDVNVIAIPVIFSNENNELEKVKNIIDMCDGIVFPGGINYCSLDCEIMKYCHVIDKPTLGLCLGMQIMGITFDGCIKCLNSENHNNEEKYVHNVKINKDSKLYKILQTDEIKVNSRHDKVVEKTSLMCSAISEDGMIEAIEDKSKKFFIGFQWHPESLRDDENSRKIFDYFLKIGG